VARCGRLGTPPSGISYEARCAFHAHAAEWPSVLKLRRRELAMVRRLGHLDEECRCRIKICRTLAEMGRPLRHEVEAARTATRRLRAPQKYLDESTEIVRGSAPGERGA